MAARSLEDRETLRIEAMRKREAERKGRFFDERARQRGMDYEALQRQIEERKKLKELEEERDRYLLEQQAAVAREQAEFEVQQREQRRKALQSTDNFNAMQAEMKYMERQIGREAALGVAAPAEPKPTVAGATLMAGEDPGAKERQKAQARQQQIWAAQQMHERKAMKEKEKEMDEEYERQMSAVYIRAEELMAEKKAAEAVRLAQMREENLKLAQMKKEREEKERLEAEKRSIEQAEHIQRDMAAREQTYAVKSAANPVRVLTTEYRGMSPEQIEAIRQEQLKQDEMKRVMKEKEEKEAQREAEELKKQIRETTRSDRLRQRQREEAAEAVRQENLRLAEAKAKKDQKLRSTYENQIDDSFFSGFGTSVR